MPGDRLLGALLRSLQISADPEELPKIFGTVSSLLTTLNNPLNVTLLTSQLLSSRAIWFYPDGLRTSSRCLSVFHSAAQALVRHENAAKENSTDHDFAELQLERTLPIDDWVRAVVNGADEHSPRWRHLLVLGGLLLGFGPREDQVLSTSLRNIIERAFVTATNLALNEIPTDDDLGIRSLTFALNYCFPHIADHERAQLNFDACLPALLRVALNSTDGLQGGHFLASINVDIQSNAGSRLGWDERSASFQDIQKMLSSPIVSALGPLSRLIGHCIENSRDPSLTAFVLEEVEQFSRALHLQWRENKLCEVDVSEEAKYFDSRTGEYTVPQLWKVLRTATFAVVIILRSAMSRMLSDRALTGPEVTPKLSTQTLRTLRNLYFISTRTNSSSFSQHGFVYFAAIDLITKYPAQAEAFIASISPTDIASVPKHPHDRYLVLFFLNTSEHFTLVLSAHTNEQLLIAASSPYLAAGGDSHLLPIFEAAHSVMLAVFSAPQNTELTAKHLPFYVQALFNVFPSNLSARQFRLAFTTLSRLTSPPSVLSRVQPLMSAILLELLHERACHAATVPLRLQSPNTEDVDLRTADLSEQAVLTITIIDTLTQVDLGLLDEWLPLAADRVNAIDDNGMRESCKEHFWHTLVDGEMDPDRSQVCHAWWSTLGGREVVLFGRNPNATDNNMAMSGALPEDTMGSKI